MSSVTEKLLNSYMGEHTDRVLKHRRKKLVRFVSGERDMVDIVSVGESVKVWDDPVFRRSSKYGKVKSFNDKQGTVELEIDGKIEVVQANRVVPIQ